MIQHFSNDIIEKLSLYLEPTEFYRIISSIKSNDNRFLDYKKDYLQYKLISRMSISDAATMGWNDYIDYSINHHLEQKNYNLITKDMWKALHLSIIHNRETIVKNILTTNIIQFSRANIYELANIITNLNYTNMVYSFYYIFFDKGYDIEEIFDNRSVINVITNNNMELVEFLYLGNVVEPLSLNYACMCGNFELVKYFYDRDFQINESTLALSTNSQNLSIIKFIHHNGGIDNGEILIEASKCGCSIDILDYIVGNFKYSYENAIEKDLLQHLTQIDNLFLFSYLLGKGVPYSLETLNLHCNCGNLNNVRCLIQIRCPVNIETLPYAIKADNLSLIKYLIELDNPIINRSIFYSLYLATKYNNQETMEYIHYHIKNNFSTHKYSLPSPIIN